ncbi:MAG: 16S rRNA (guanine(966)-N(2))-methyltransferase RsmD [Rhizobiaceae bacterium]
MRIVAGSLRGRRLLSPKGHAIRPTTDRNRESLFNILNHRFSDQLAGRVLDIFAGTGALGLEALSRGAEAAVFIEKSGQGAALVTEHIESFKLADRATLLKRDATRPGPLQGLDPFDLIFADPPYGKGLGEKAVAELMANGWFADGSVLVLEEKAGALPELLEWFERRDSRSFGETEVGFYQYVTSR